MAKCNVQTLLNNARGFTSLSGGEIDVLELQLLCEILNAPTGGGGGAASGITCANYGGGTPSFTPTTGCAIALDTSTGSVWYYFSGSWNLSGPVAQRPQTIWAQAFPGSNGGVMGQSMLNQTNAYGTLSVPAGFFTPGKILYFTTQALNISGDITPPGPLRISFNAGGPLVMDFAAITVANGGGLKFEAWISGQDPVSGSSHVRGILRAHGEDQPNVDGFGADLTHTETPTILLPTNGSITFDVLDNGYGLNFDSTYFQLI